MESFVARQPILDVGGHVYGYELLFRSDLSVNSFQHHDGDQASSKVIADSALLFGLDTLAAGRRAFINVTRDVLVKDFISFLPKERVVVELLESIRPDAAVVRACRELKDAGYLLALDDFEGQPGWDPLVEMADVIKIDLLATAPADQARIVEKCRRPGVRFLAEKVESWEAFENCRNAGYTLFQGYYFCKPAILARRDIAGSRANYLRILNVVQPRELDMERLAGIIKQEVSLSYKLLRHLNSASFGLRSPVNSVRRALALLGEDGIRKWVSLSVLVGMADGKPDELVVQAVMRGRYCELLAPDLGMPERGDDLFVLGMFSLLEAFLDRPMQEILEELPLRDDIKSALTSGRGRLGALLEYLGAMEAACWEDTERLAARLGLTEGRLVTQYREAVTWSADAVGRQAA